MKTIIIQLLNRYIHFDWTHLEIPLQKVELFEDPVNLDIS